MIKNNPRILHTMLRVGNLEQSLDFYINKLGMRQLRREEYKRDRFTLVFLGYGNEETHCVIELTHNWDQTSYDNGDGFGHIALGVSDIENACKSLSLLGVNILRPPAPMKYQNSNNHQEIIAFIEDPNGYKIELIQRN